MGLGRPEAPPLEQFLAIGLDKRTAQNAVVNQKVTSNLLLVIKEAGVEMCDKAIGNLLYTVATKYPANALVHRPMLVKYVVSTKIHQTSVKDQRNPWSLYSLSMMGYVT
jgi:glutaminyl-tRNA synthetase